MERSFKSRIQLIDNRIRKDAAGHQPGHAPAPLCRYWPQRLGKSTLAKLMNAILQPTSDGPWCAGITGRLDSF
jgi:hypothetical protein